EGAPPPAGRGARGGADAKKSSGLAVETALEPEGAPGVAALEVDVAGVLGRRPPLDRLERSRTGRRARSLVSERKGKYDRHRLARHEDADIAFDATLRAAAVRGGAPISVRPEDLRRKV